MTTGIIHHARARADARLSLLASRRRMTIEQLAGVFVASGMRPEVPEETMQRARIVVSIQEASVIMIGPTFADTVAINRPFLDLYEAEPAVRRIQCTARVL
jgi:hypothetical protein